RGGAGRTGRARPGEFRQFRRLARAAGAIGRAQAACQRASPPAHREIRHGGGGSMGARSPPAAGEIRADGSGPRSRRARGAHLVAPLRRRLLAAHRTRGCLAAALARSAARLSPAREPRGDPWRAFRARFLGRAICPSGCGGHVTRGAAATGPGCVALAGAARLSLVGILRPGPRLRALTGNRLLYRDGLPIALLAAGEVQFLETLDAASEWEAHKALLRCAEPASSIVSDTQLRGRNG